MYYDDFSKRLTQLRQKKGVTARDMSLSLGQSESYINKIENNYSLPSMNGFFYILTNTLLQSCGKLTAEQTEALIKFIKTI